MTDIVFKSESYAIVGACFEVYNEMGPGFLETVYQECLGIEMLQRRISFRSQVDLELSYKEVLLDAKFRPDFVCYDKIILEIKSVRELTDQHLAQVHNYLRATSLKLGLLVNFGDSPRLQYKRIVY